MLDLDNGIAQPVWSIPLLGGFCESLGGVGLLTGWTPPPRLGTYGSMGPSQRKPFGKRLGVEMEMGWVVGLVSAREKCPLGAYLL